jgi:hypothetical protein
MNAITWRRGWLAMAVLGGALAVGCGPTRPPLYAVRGRVLDANTRQGVAQANLLLRALIVREGGVAPTRDSTTLVAYGLTDSDGAFEIALAGGFEVLRQARQIRLEAVKSGYTLSTTDISPPTRKEESYKVPDIVIARNNYAPWGTK